MKKAIAPFLAVIALALVASCSSLPFSYGNAARGGFSKDGVYYETGFAKGTNSEKAKKKAESSAKNKIAMRIEADAERALEMYVQDAGIDDETDLEDLIEEIAKDVAESAFSKAYVKEVRVDSEGTAHVLVGYDFQSLATELQMRVESSVKSESSSLAEFSAHEALRFLFE